MEPSDKPGGGATRQKRWYNFNTVFGGVFVILSITIFLIIPDQVEKPLIVFAANENDLDASLFPQLVAAGFGGLGIWLFFKSFSLNEHNAITDIDKDAAARVIVTLLAMAAYGPVMMSVGFVVSSALLIVFLSTFFGNRNYVLATVISVGVPVSMYFAFTKLLATYLPPFPIDTALTRLYIL